MNKSTIFACLSAIAVSSFARETIPLTDWKFRFCGGTKWNDSRVNEPNGCHKPNYDDKNWRKVKVPHDWGIDAPFDKNCGTWTGALPCFGVGWYRMKLKTTPEMANGRTTLEFDGVMSDSEVFVNGINVGGRPYGYSSFSVDITDALQDAKTNENTIAVRANNVLGSGRWYTGGGLYRPVRLVVTGKTRIAFDGVWVKPALSSDLTKGSVEIDVEVEGDKEGVEIKRSILGNENLQIEKPRLWDIVSPNLYTARVELVKNNKTLDAMDIPFGFRRIEFKPKEGFFLNARHLKINGVCLHHDLGALGAAVERVAIRRQLQIMLDMGANAVRTSHNPPCRELLDLCDEMGIMVLDEVFDEWAEPKNGRGYARFFNYWAERDFRDLVRRDRNHPSVIAWSIGNEVWEQKSPATGRRIAKRLRDVVKREDPYRPVTMGCDSKDVYTNNLEEAMDIYGVNYRPDDYGKLLELYPDKGVLGTETASMVSSRDTYFFPLPKGFEKRPRPFNGGFIDNQVSSYDIFSQRPHNYHPDVEFYYQQLHPQVYGEFIWTGIDYLGEPSPYMSSRSSYYGAADLCGFPKDRYYAYQAQWKPEKPMIHILPHWTWPGREGETTPVWAYTSGDEAELFINGKSLGRRKKDKAKGIYTLEWNDAKYEKGEIRAVAYKNGKKWAETVRRTAESVVSVKIEEEKSSSGDNLVFYKISLVDKFGTVVPNDDKWLAFSVENGTLAGVCNGDAFDMTGLVQPKQKTFRGLCQAIVRRTPGAKVKLHAVLQK
jgi:beta-galactosidase